MHPTSITLYSADRLPEISMRTWKRPSMMAVVAISYLWKLLTPSKGMHLEVCINLSTNLLKSQLASLA